MLTFYNIEDMHRKRRERKSFSLEALARERGIKLKLPEGKKIRISEYFKSKRSMKDEVGSNPGSGDLRMEKVPTLKGLIGYIQDNLKESDGIDKKLKLFEEMQAVLESEYTFRERSANFSEEIREIDISGKKTRIHVLYPISEKTKKELGIRKDFFGNSPRNEVMDIFEDYVRRSAKSAFNAYSELSEISRKRSDTTNLEEIIRGHPLVKVKDVINYKEVLSEADVAPNDVYLGPNGCLDKWTGMAYMDNGGAVLNIRGIIRDLILSKNPKENDAPTGGHEFVHEKLQEQDRLFEHEHGTRLNDFASSGEDNFIWEFLYHPYSSLTGVLNVASTYFDPGIEELSGQNIATEFGETFLWNKNMLKDKGLIERLKKLKKPLTDLIFEAESEYASVNKYGLDTLIVLTGMPTFPLWLKAAQHYTPKVSEKEKLDFERDYKTQVKLILRDLKEEFFDATRDNLVNGYFWSFDEFDIKYYFEDSMGIFFPKMSRTEKILSWDLFLKENFLKNDDDFEQKIDYSEVFTDDVHYVIKEQAKLLKSMLQYSSNGNFEKEGSEKFLKRLALYDYITERLNLAANLSLIKAEDYWANYEGDEARKIQQYNPVLLDPKQNLIELYEFSPELGDKQIIKLESQTDFSRGSNNGKERFLKVVIGYNDDETNPLSAAFFRGERVTEKVGEKRQRKIYYEGEPSGVMFKEENALRPNVLVYSRNARKDSAGYNCLDAAVKARGVINYIPFELMFDEDFRTHYLEGKEAFEVSRKKLEDKIKSSLLEGIFEQINPNGRGNFVNKSYLTTSRGYEVLTSTMSDETESYLKVFPCIESEGITKDSIDKVITDYEIEIGGEKESVSCIFNASFEKDKDGKRVVKELWSKQPCAIILNKDVTEYYSYDPKTRGYERSTRTDLERKVLMEMNEAPGIPIPEFKQEDIKKAGIQKYNEDFYLELKITENPNLDGDSLEYKIKNPEFNKDVKSVEFLNRSNLDKGVINLKYNDGTEKQIRYQDLELDKYPEMMAQVRETEDRVMNTIYTRIYDRPFFDVITIK